MEIHIRPALATEIETLLAFEKAIIEAERPYDSTLQEGDIHYYDLSELINATDAEVVVAVVNNEVVGSGYAKIKKAEPYLKHLQYAHLGFMYVKPAFRGNGINQKIVNALINWAKSERISEIRLEVYDNNTIAKQAYLKAGFQPNLLEMRIEVAL